MKKEPSRTVDAPDDLVAETLKEHDQCMWVVAEVEACLEKRPDRDGVWLSELLEKLSRLEAAMRAHFRVEETGPIYRQLPVKHPRFADRAAALEGEHKQILATLRKVADKASAMAGEAEPYELRELNAHAQLLLATLQRHEAEENELVLEANWTEVGVGD